MTAEAASGRRATAATRLLAVLAAAAAAALVLLINVDVLSRAVAARPVRGVNEIVSIALPAIVFLALADLARTGRLIRAGLLERVLGATRGPVRLGFDATFALLGAALTAAILAAVWPRLLYALASGEFLGVEGDFTAPVWPARLAIVVGAAALAAVLLGDARKAVAALGRLGPSAWPRALVPPLGVGALLLLYLLVDGRAAIGGLSVGLLFVLLYAGLPVAFALLAAGAAGIAAIKGSAVVAVDTLGLAASGAVSSYVFAAVPLFVTMGLVVGAADIGRDSLQAAHWVLRRVRGGLGIATVAANAVFAAVTGISIASAAIFSKVAVPPLIAHGFAPRFAVGIVAGSSVLGMLLPPSLLLIVYGLVAEVSINALFLAAVVPGLILAGVFALAVASAARLRPAFAMTSATEDDTGPGIGAAAALGKALPVTLLIALVLGGIYGGVFTPTEAGAVGTLAALVIALAMRRITLHRLGGLLFEAAGTSSSILFLIVAASAFGMMLTLSGIPGHVGAYAADLGLGLTAYALAYLVVLILLGMVVDSTSILLIMVPLALPAVNALGGDLVWFGIVTVIGVEIGLLTPPLGLSVFAIKSSLDNRDIGLNDIFLGAFPFALMMLAVTVLLIAVPGLARVLL